MSGILFGNDLEDFEKWTKNKSSAVCKDSTIGQDQSKEYFQKNYGLFQSISKGKCTKVKAL